MLKPVLPYVTDLAEHILNFESHMATVHAHDGKYHTHTEVAEGAKNDSPEKNTDNVLNKGTSSNEHVIASKSDIFPPQQLVITYAPALCFNVENIYLSSDFPPPKV